MEQHRNRDHQHIGRLVRAFVSPSTPASELPRVVDGLRDAIRSPSDIISCETIPDDHPLKLEALAARDAFEAVTNGMSSPEAFEALERIGERAVFRPWADAIRAIAAFYANDIPAAEDFAAKSGGRGFLSRTGPLWTALLQRSGRVKAAHGWLGPFLSKLFPEADSLVLGVEEFREALDQDLSEQAVARAARIVRTLAELSPQKAHEAILAFLGEIDERGMDPDPFIRSWRALAGESATLRLVSLFLGGKRPCLALLYWLKAAAVEMAARPDRVEFAAWLMGASRMIGAARAESDAWEGELSALVDALADISGSIGSGDTAPLKGFKALDRLAGLCVSNGVVEGAVASAGVARRRTRAKPKNQLELFPERS
jgi:hypothetical protein